MYVPRHLDRVLAEWYRGAARKPLVIRGARQTGKSTSVREFGSRAPCFVELNLERFDDLALTRGVKDAEQLLEALRVRDNIPRFPDDTVLFIDEIQENPDVIAWLRFLFEDHPEIAVVATGSLLDVKMRGEGFSFPVGRVSFRRLGPFSFFEFLEAAGKSQLVGTLRRSLAALEGPATAIHQVASRQFGKYLVVGGMPEAVSRFVDVGSVAAAAEVHRDLRQAFAEDIQKYAKKTAVVEAAFASLRQHYGTRFKYENFVPGRKSVEMQDALGLLEAAMIIHRALPSASRKLPIVDKPRVAPKLIPLDVGLALADFGLPVGELDKVPPEELLGGRFAECAVGQQLLSSPSGDPERLHFWVRDKASGSAEVDFLLPTGSGLVPLEVKSGKSGSLKSLHQFLYRAGGTLGLRLYSGEMADEAHEVAVQGDRLRYRLLSLPLYLAEGLVEPDLSDALFESSAGA